MKRTRLDDLISECRSLDMERRMLASSPNSCIESFRRNAKELMAARDARNEEAARVEREGR